MIYVLAKTTEELKLLLDHLVKCGGQLFDYDPVSPETYVQSWPNCLFSTIRPETLTLTCGYLADYPKALQKQRKRMQLSPVKILSVKQALATIKPFPPFVKGDAPALYLGFEIEGCIDEGARPDLIAYLRDLYPRTPIDHLVHRDGSIRPQSRAIEIVTPPLPQHEAFERLEWLLGTLSVLTEEGLFETNASCGLHVNVSDAVSFKTPQRTHRERFAYAFLHKLDAAKWRRSFRRGRNRYCGWTKPPESVADINGGTYANHYSAINTQNLHDGDPNARRIEVRAAGGSHYHTKHERLRDYLLDITDAAHHAHATL
jgi:putative amidoligase enzyme